MILFWKKKAETAPETVVPETAELPVSWWQRVRKGLSKTTSQLTDGIARIFTGGAVNEYMLEALEEVLIGTDMGLESAQALVKKLAKTSFDKNVSEAEVRAFLAGEIAGILSPVARPLVPDVTHKPAVVLVVGVNGNGKTTTIGKLANQFSAQGHKVVLAAADTFRAAAVEQLSIWAERSGCALVAGVEQGDPASVAYRALDEAKKAGADILLVDTAGRLQNKTDLMAQLEKVVRVLKKLDPDAPHHVVQVLDATTGQNAHRQVEQFKELIGVTGLVVTKLDGTAKGGMVVALAKRFGLPIHAIGVGEGIADLQPFEAEDFARHLVGLTNDSI
jgi:fused signal recognition particle receptor